MTSIKLKKTTAVGGTIYAAGSVVEASTYDAKFLINTNKAVLHEEKAKPAKKAPNNKKVKAEDLETR